MRVIRGMVRFCVHAAVLAGGLCGSQAGAGIATDGSLRAPVVLAGPDYRVTPSLGRLLGSNLFFSFSQFNLEAGESATFSGPRSISRIISRVTGGSVSSIDGYLASTIPGADFYFINPAGVVFGSNASIDVGGSFYVSTAQYLKLGGGGSFDAANPSGSSLTSAPPEAFGFLGGQGTIALHRAKLNAAEGKDIALIGGDIELDGAKLSSPAGSLRLAATQGASELTIAPVGVQATTDLRGNVQLHGNSELVAYSSGDASPGSIAIQGGTLQIDQTQITSANGFDGVPGDIVLAASESITIGRDGKVNAFACDYGVSGCDANGASISLSAPVISLQPLSVISATTFGAGDGGDIRLEASQSLTILGLEPGQGTARGDVDTATFGAGQGGDIHVHTPQLDIRQVGGLMTYSCGDDCFGDDPPIVPQYGAAGSIFVDADRIHLSEQSYFDAASFSNGPTGNIVVHAGESLILTGIDERLVTDRPNNTSISPFGSGGSVTIETPLLRIENGAEVIATTSGPGSASSITVSADRVELLDEGQIFTATFSDGNAGDIHILAREAVDIVGVGGKIDFNSGIASETFSSGSGGQVLIETPSLRLDQGGFISVAAFEDGPAGSIVVDADNILIDGLSQIVASNYSSTQPDTEPKAGDVGDITLIARESLVVTGSDSVDSSAVLLLNFGSGEGGQLTVRTPHLVVDPMSLLSAQGYRSGPGGTVDVTADLVELRGGVINAKSEGTGSAGTIVVRAADALLLTRGGGIETSTTQSDGGDIELSVGRLLYLENSVISTSSGGGAGNGGNIRIDPRYVVLNDSDITADAFGGNGGNIQIVADQFLPSADSLVRASSALGIDGDIDISSPVVDVGESLGRLRSDYLDTSRGLRNTCAGGAAEAGNSFIALGRGGLPAGAAGPQFAPLTAMLQAPGPQQTALLAALSLSDLGPAACMNQLQ